MLVSFAGRKEKIDFRFPKSKLQLSPVLRYSFKNATKSCMTSTSTFRRFYVENAVRKQKQLLVISNFWRGHGQRQPKNLSSEKASA